MFKINRKLVRLLPNCVFLSIFNKKIMDTKNLKVGDKITILFGNDMKEGLVKERRELEKGLVEYEIQIDDQIIKRTDNRIVIYPKK